MERIGTIDKFWMQAALVTDGYLFAMLTDEIVWKRWPLGQTELKSFQEKEKKLLNIRIFDRDREVCMIRGDVGRKLQGRIQDDSRGDLKEQDYFDEEQYLDIDMKRSKELFNREGKVQATGGGQYELPLSGFENAKVRIRNYLGYYEESGQVYVKDWRLAEIFQEKR
ncbi:MAG: hypothetical protein HFG73_03870 [Hungatella sp.]|nr:hypothetical protein [Hungatella sp.]